MKLCKYVLTMIVILSYFIGSHLPLSWGWENSPIEWSQVVILSMGALLAWKWRQEIKSAGQDYYARFFFWAIPLWLLMIGREISWGRVFYPVGINATTGPFFKAIFQLPYGPIVYPMIAAVILMWLFTVTKYKLYTVPYELFQQGYFPTGEFLLVIFSFIVAYIAEKHMKFAIMEEIVECVAYLSLILTAYRVKVALLQNVKRIKDEKFFSEIDRTVN